VSTLPLLATTLFGETAVLKNRIKVHVIQIYNMYYLYSGLSGSGFTNQLFNIITGIIIAYIHREKVVVIDKFINDITNDNYTPISEIINLTALNVFLKENLDIITVDRSNINFEIIHVKFGTELIQVDITDHILKKYYDSSNNKLCINKDSVFRNVYGDPCPGIFKRLFFKYKINGYGIEEIYGEKLQKDIIVDFDSPYNFNLGDIAFNNPLFESILSIIEYNPEFTLNAEMVLKEIDMDKKINVIHLRVEDDAIKYWSKQNNMSQEDYKAYIENKYIGLIQKYISREDNTIILSHSKSNSVIDFLNQNNFTYMYVHKFYDDREKNAIVDLLVSKCCNNIFIGNYNMFKLNGSTFSYYVSRSIQNNITRVCIDPDNILLSERVSYKL
jgi:hypothetical protein